MQIEDDPARAAEEKDTKLFPPPTQEDQRITCHELTNDFLIYATNVGFLIFFSNWLQDADTIVPRSYNELI